MKKNKNIIRLIDVLNLYKREFSREIFKNLVKQFQRVNKVKSV